MLLNLGMPASAAATHRHEFSAPPTAGMTPTEEQGSAFDLLSPLRYLQGRWQARTGPEPTNAEAPADDDVAPPSAASLGPPAIDVASAEARDDVSEPSYCASVVDGSLAGDTNSLRLGFQQTGVKCSKTAYQLALPPPKVGRFRVRRRLLLQLRQAARGQRAAVPVLELFATTNLSRSVAKSRTRKPSLSASEEFVVSSCEPYARASPAKVTDLAATSDDEDTEGVCRTIARIRQGAEVADAGAGTVALVRAEINIGLHTWRAMALANGYEFVRAGPSDGDEGVPTRVRWVGQTKAQKRRSQSDPPAPSAVTSARAAAVVARRAFRFILVSPTGRRHPVVAHLDRAALHVFNQYPLPSASTPPFSSAASFDPSHPSTPVSLAPNFYACSALDANASGQVATTTETTRMLTLVTAVWVALAEGWLPGSSAGSDAATVPPSPGLAPPRAGPGKNGRRSTSSPVADSRPTTPSFDGLAALAVHPRLTDVATTSRAGFARTGSAPASPSAVAREKRLGLGIATRVTPRGIGPMGSDGTAREDEDLAGRYRRRTRGDSRTEVASEVDAGLVNVARESVAESPRPSCDSILQGPKTREKKKREMGRKLLNIVRKKHGRRSEK